MQKTAIIISLFIIIICSCNEREKHDISYNLFYSSGSPMIEVNNDEGKFHDELKYYDSENSVRLSQMWKNGRIDGFSKYYDSDGILIFENIQTDSTFDVTYGSPYSSDLDYYTDDLASFYIDMAQIEFLDSLNFEEPFRFRFNNIPETYLTVSVHGHHLKKTKNAWEVIPKKIQDSLKIDISIELNNVLHKKTFTTSFNGNYPLKE